MFQHIFVNYWHNNFLSVNEPWLLNGMYEYYLLCNSERAMEILVNIKEPHNLYLFDRWASKDWNSPYNWFIQNDVFRLWDSLKGTNAENRIKGLTLFGYVVRNQPTWLYKLQDHNLLRELLKLLKVSCYEHILCSFYSTYFPYCYI